MADTTLAPTGLVQIEVGASDDTWGAKLNANMAILNTLLGALALTEGVWTPTVSFSTPGTSSFAYTTQYGAYQRIGAWVRLDLFLVFTPTIGTGAGTLLIGGVPVAALNSSAATAASGAVSSLSGAFGGYSGALAMTFSGTASLRFFYTAPGGSNAIAASNMTTGVAHSITASIFYRAA